MGLRSKLLRRVIYGIISWSIMGGDSEGDTRSLDYGLNFQEMVIYETIRGVQGGIKGV